MASGSTAHPAFPPRSAYTSAGKLPDRSNPPPFGSSSRRPDAPPPAQQQQQQQQQKEINALNDLGEDQREEITGAFNLFDLDRDRHLDYHELRVALRALGFQLPKPELLHLLNTHGVSRSSVRGPSSNSPGNIDRNVTHPSQLLISQNAFGQIAATKMLARNPREEIERAFELFDGAGKGWIDFEDLRRVARELGETGLEEEELRAMIEEFDLDGTGGVGKEAFVGICLQ